MRHNEHGSITYFTAHQNAALSMALFGGILMFLLAIAILPRRDVAQGWGFLSWRMIFKPDDPEGVRHWFSALGLGAGLFVVHLIDPTLFRWCYEQLLTVRGPAH